jgi:DNA polymerase-1
MPTTLFEPGSEDVLVVVDLSAQLFRAYHAIRPLSSPSGEPTHAVYGVVTMLERLVKDVRPTRLAIALDSGRKNTFRAKIYPEYKANRPEAPEDLVIQLRRASEVVRAFTPHVWQKEGFEADDLIATAVHRARAQGLRVLVLGADKDLMQMCGEDVRLWDTMRDKVVGPPEVFEKFGVRVDQLGDLLALTGDSSDNIPGVPGIGPKTAAELLGSWNDLDGIYSHLSDISRKRVRELLAEHEPMARLSRRLVQLDLDCDDRIDPLNTQWHGRDTARLHALYTELGFTRFAASLEANARGQGELAWDKRTENVTAKTVASVTATESPFSPNVEAVRFESFEALEHWLNETAPLQPWSVAVAGPDSPNPEPTVWVLAITCAQGRTALVRFASPTPESNPPDTGRLYSLLAAQLTQPNVCLQVHGAKRFWLALLGTVAENTQVTFDTELASYLLDPEESHGLDALAQRYLGEKPTTVIAAFPRKRSTLAPTLESVEQQAIRESQLIHRVSVPLTSRLNEEGLTDLLQQVELPLARVLANMQRRGVLVDTSRLAEMSIELDREMSRLEAEAVEVAGHPFNLNSPRQLETILFDELGLKPHRRTKTSRSTDAATLETLAEEHPLPRLILQHRQVAKLKSTYVDALPHLVNPLTGRVHSSWEQTVTSTGRLSSTEPNLQNIPVRTSLGRAIRKAFVSPPGTKLVSADYSQIELRILAHLAQDPALLHAFTEGEDVHLHTAAAVFGVPENEVTQEMRRQAKAVNFGVIYGQGESGLAAALGIPKQQAGEFIAAYYRKYRGVREFMNMTLEQARHGKAVRSVLGRRRYFNDIDSANRGLRLSAERMAMNMPIQATAADVLKLAMIKLDEPITPGSRMVMTVHDELVFEVPESEVELAKEKIRQIMQNVMAFSVPLLVDVGVADNWSLAH